MPDKKLTDNDIKKALECCRYNDLKKACKKCPFDKEEHCLDAILNSALDLINRLQAEKENLKDILYDGEGVNLVNYWHQQCKIAENGCKNFSEENKNLKAEIERLKNRFMDMERSCHNGRTNGVS